MIHKIISGIILAVAVLCIIAACSLPTPAENDATSLQYEINHLPRDVTDVVPVDPQPNGGSGWYTFKWHDQCFLDYAAGGYSRVTTKIDCK